MSNSNHHVSIHLPTIGENSRETFIEENETTRGRRSRRNSADSALGRGSRTNSPRPASRSPRRSRRSLDAAINDAAPLLETDLPPRYPPLAGPEIDDNDSPDDDVPYNSDAHPGVDDGFFPEVGSRAGEDDPEEKPVAPNGQGPRRGSVPAAFPYAPDFGPSVLINPETPRVIPDVNVYQHKKTLAQGMMDLALLSANANQLRYVLESYTRHPYYYFSVTFISMSLILQVAVGIGLVLNSRYDVRNQDDICKANKINNFTVIGIFLITIVNVFISSFGVADPPPDMRN
ncbi:ninjurin-A-like isoform X2 [Phlebotomus argentipes]|uniref:ninjurin-A-like isoform X2 n=1 Tax=Phlebotomus argentipes TaxID=94469 RepID=UPI002892B600|nr:ninjurin-A-like isoform X2 [Phlebotomus argentipes]